MKPPRNSPAYKTCFSLLFFVSQHETLRLVFLSFHLEMLTLVRVGSPLEEGPGEETHFAQAASRVKVPWTLESAALPGAQAVGANHTALIPCAGE